MESRFLSTGVSALLNSPVLSKFAQVQEDCLENVYKTKQLGPLGRAPSPKIPTKVVKSFFGRPSEKGKFTMECEIAVFEYMYCCKKYKKKKILYEHIREVHKVPVVVEGNLKCPINVCNFSCRTFEDLRNYIKDQH